MVDTKILENLVNDTLNESPTFSDEMIKKVRNELLKAKQDAENYYKEKAEII